MAEIRENIFRGVVGQRRVKKFFVHCLEKNRLAHAYLFQGQAGVGKDAMAISLAMTLNCDRRTSGGCGNCPTCRAMCRLEYPYFRMIMPVPPKPKGMRDEKYNQILMERALLHIRDPYREINFYPELSGLPVIGIDQIRSVKKDVMLRMAGEGSRVFIISNIERITQEAANSRLKLLEEPPERTVLCLTTSFPSRVLKTVISRCQVIGFDLLSSEEIESALIERWGVDKGRAKLYSRMACGSLRKGISFLEEEFDSYREEAFRFLKNTIMGSRQGSIDAMDRLSGVENIVEAKRILELTQILLRDMFLVRNGLRERVMNSDLLGEIEKFQEGVSFFDYDKGTELITRAVTEIERNIHLPLVVYSLGMELFKCLKS